MSNPNPVPQTPQDPPQGQATFLDIPPRIDGRVLMVRVVAALFASLSASLSTDATNKQMAANALLAVATVLFGLFGDARGRFKHTRRRDRPSDSMPPNLPGGGGG